MPVLISNEPRRISKCSICSSHVAYEMPSNVVEHFAMDHVAQEEMQIKAGVPLLIFLATCGWG